MEKMRSDLEQAREELCRSNLLVSELRAELDSKDAVIRDLQLQLEKFRVVMKPMTEQVKQNLLLWSRQTSLCPTESDEPLAAQRPKRLAISAEPVDLLLGTVKIKEVAKSDT
ncbi:uncharacterized protein LOC135368746 [Ornithodoros turicata]|uniref:uncharacterized protein LOC135368746 n=1 Tax=Ornithodoros turicata TaxID=34597 RepID=UPI0031387797